MVDDDGAVLFRCRIYRVAPGKSEAFARLFREHLLPLQKRHGARLVGRWQTEDGDEVIALWAYRDRAEYERVDAAVRADPDFAQGQERQRDRDPLFTEKRELFLTPTVALAETELKHLDER